MRRLTSIVAVNRDGVIGAKNSLPWRIKSDLIFFRDSTSSNVVIMGRKTHDSLGRCLPNRYNVVVSSKTDLFLDRENCVVRHGIREALAEAEKAPSNFQETFVIGGATMYEQFAPFVDRYLITVIDKPVPEGDAFFDLSILSNEANWAKTKLDVISSRDDEAPFEVFELNAHDRKARQSRRQELLRGGKPAPRSGGNVGRRVETWAQPTFVFG